MSSSGRNFGLDLLRCFAIGGVVLAHGWYFIYPWAPAIPVGGGRHLHLYHLGHAGFYGVELFFVLSGFLIGGILLRIGEKLADGRELRGFYVRRWFRTLPNYYVFLLLNVIFFGTWAQSPRYWLFLQNFASNRVTFFPESWSLGVEEWFYLLFPFTLWLLLRIRRSMDWAVLTAGVGFYVGSTWLRLVAASDPSHDWAAAIRTTTVLRFDALMTGILAAWLAARRPRLFTAWPALKAVGGVALLGFCYATLYWDHAQNETLFARSVRFNLVSLGFALLLPLAVSWQVRSKAVEQVARWSYAMYFINLPVFYVLDRHLVPQSQTSAAQGWTGFNVLVLGTTALAGVWYHVFERPTTALRDRA